jgi:hypothetical protein
MQLETQTVFIAGKEISKLNIKGLEKREGVIILTVDELKKIAGDAFKEGYMKNPMNYPPDLDAKATDYLNQLIKP